MSLFGKINSSHMKIWRSAGVALGVFVVLALTAFAGGRLFMAPGESQAASAGNSSTVSQSGFYIDLVNSSAYQEGGASMKIYWNISDVNTSARTGRINVYMQMTKTYGAHMYFDTHGIKLAGTSYGDRTTPLISVNTNVISTSWTFSYSSSGSASVWIGDSSITGYFYTSTTGACCTTRTWSIPGFTVYPDMIDPAWSPPSGMSATNITSTADSVSATVGVASWGVSPYTELYYRYLAISESSEDCCDRWTILYNPSNTINMTINMNNSDSYLTRIDPNWHYYLWGYASNGLASTELVRLGEVVTKAMHPELTGDVYSITNSSAKVDWTAYLWNGDYYPIYNGVQVRKHGTANWINCSTMMGGSSGASFCMGLEENTTYDVRPVATTTAGADYGDVAMNMFSTSSVFGGAPAPTLDFSMSSNQVSFNVAPNGTDSLSDVVSAVATTDNPAGYNLTVELSGSETCLKHALESAKDCGSIETPKKFSQFATPTATTLAVGEWALKRGTTYHRIPSMGAALNLTSSSAPVVNDTTDMYFAAKSDLNMTPGVYGSEVTFSAVMNLPAAPTITKLSKTSGPLGGGTEVAITGTGFDTVYAIKVGGEDCAEKYKISNTELTCVTPAGVEAGATTIEVATWGGTVEAAFTYLPPVTEMWGFTIDTSAGAAVAFSANNSTAMQVDWGNGNWVNVAAGAKISGTAVATSGTLAHVKIRPVDASAYGWFPIDNGFVFDNGYNSLTTIDYPLTTRAIANASGTITKTLMNAFAYNTRQTNGVYFATTVPVTAIPDNFLVGAHATSPALVAPVDLSGLAGNPITGVGMSFIQNVHRSNAALAIPMDLSAINDWPVTSVGDQFLMSAHNDNTSLLDISGFRVPNWAKSAIQAGIASSSYGGIMGMMSSTFALPSAKTTVGGEPRFMDGSFISSVGTPADNYATYKNRSSITPLNPNWK
jgi:hypothetical protein